MKVRGREVVQPAGVISMLTIEEVPVSDPSERRIERYMTRECCERRGVA
jgi:hypothetical protein